MEARAVAWRIAPGEALRVLDEASLALVRERVRAGATAAGLAVQAAEEMVVVASELGRNLLVHAVGGAMAVRGVERDAVAGLEVVACDDGPGIRDLSSALAGGHSTAGGLGHGLESVRRLADEVDVDVRLGEGTCVWARRFAARPPWRSEVAAMGRPMPGERRNGDQCLFLRRGGRLVVAAIDGLGHGALAADAADAAVEIVAGHCERPPEQIVAECDRGLRGKRGVVMAVTVLDRAAGTVEHAAVGNVRTFLVGPRSARGLRTTPGTVGVAGRPLPRVAVERAAWASDDLLVACTDGLRSGVAAGWHASTGRHPALVAHGLLEKFARQTDDALVLVAS